MCVFPTSPSRACYLPAPPPLHTLNIGSQHKFVQTGSLPLIFQLDRKSILDFTDLPDVYLNVFYLEFCRPMSGIQMPGANGQMAGGQICPAEWPQSAHAFKRRRRATKNLRVQQRDSSQGSR
jgi:hypothetical protein